MVCFFQGTLLKVVQGKSSAFGEFTQPAPGVPDTVARGLTPPVSPGQAGISFHVLNLSTLANQLRLFLCIKVSMNKDTYVCVCCIIVCEGVYCETLHGGIIVCCEYICEDICDFWHDCECVV